MRALTDGVDVAARALAVVEGLLQVRGDDVVLDDRGVAVRALDEVLIDPDTTKSR